MDEFEKEIAKNVAELSKEVAGDIIRPVSKSIGDNLGMMIDGVMGWLGYWGQKQKILQEKYVNDFKEKVYIKIGNIPQDNLIEPAISIVGPIIEPSKYYYEGEYFREMFSELLAAACDKKHIYTIHRSFVEILKQLSPLDAKLLGSFRYNNSYPICDIEAIDKNTKLITPFYQSIFDFLSMENEFSPEERIFLTASLDNLKRLGILIKNTHILQKEYDYNNFKNSFMYKEYERIKDPDGVLKILPARMELTDFGRGFVSCCFPKQSKNN